MDYSLFTAKNRISLSASEAVDAFVIFRDDLHETACGASASSGHGLVRAGRGPLQALPYAKIEWRLKVPERRVFREH